MSIEVRNIEKRHLEGFVTTIEHAFGAEMRASDIPNFERKIDIDRMHAAFDDDQIVGTAGVFPFRFTIPGNVVDAAGVTMVGVLPSHRRRGILRSMMETQMRDAHDRDEHIAVLWASEESIYQRFGYGLASNQGHVNIERDRAAFLDDQGPIGRVRMVPADERLKVLPSIYEQIRKDTPGMYERSLTWWEVHSFYDPEHLRHGATPYFCAVVELDGEPSGYVVYRMKSRWADDTTPASVVEVHEALATSPDATREVWRYVFGIDLVQRITAYYLPADWPVFLMVPEPRRLRFSFSESLWLRIVDIEGALADRSYAAETALTFEVVDEFCPWNTGRWKLDTATARVERTEDEPDLALKVNALAGPYLGGFTFTELAAAGRVTELTPGALERADAAFHTPRKPWCPENF
ncbi:MAG: GNAT family N-acetyltransferase [Actinobacteria bacterium]|nr:GNAT family N-acetyltransferase [Actinomycetota bacterium]